MKFKGLLTLCLAGASLTAFAQTHNEGAEYYKADQFDNAKELLERGLNNAATDKAVANYYLGMIAVEENKLADAARYFDAGLQANPEYAYNYVGKGLLALKQGQDKVADEDFKMARKNSKKDPSLEIAIASAYNDADPVKFEKQITKCVEKARKYDMKNPDIYIFEGDVLRAKKDIGGAAAKYEMAAGYDKDYSPAYVKYANLFTKVNPDYAIKMLNDLLAVNSESALGQRELANAYYNAKDYKNAALKYGSYVNNPAHFKKDEDRYAFLLFYGGDYKKGYDYATQLLKNNPKNFTAQRYQFMNAAQLPEMKDQYLPLAEALLATHKTDPKNNKFAAIDYTLIASELSEAKRPDEALNVLLEGVAEIPDYANFHKQIANVYVDQDDLAKAADAYHDYLNKTEEPGYNDFVQQAIYAYYGGAQNIQKDPVASDKYFGMSAEYAQKASDMAPNQYKPIKILGDIAIAKAPNDEARKSAGQPLYEKAIVLLEGAADPSRYKTDAKTIYTYLGNYYISKDNVAKAKEYYNKFLELDPNNADVRKYVEGLK